MKKMLTLSLAVILSLCCLASCDSSKNENLPEESKSSESDIAKIVIDCEKELKDKNVKLQKESPEYNFYCPYVVAVHCSYKLSNNATADAIVEKYDMNNIFAKATVSAFNDINVKTINIVFDRDDFTEAIHQKLNQIKDEEPLVEKLSVGLEKTYEKSYMPRIEHYAENTVELDYETENSLINLHDDNSFIIKSKQEYDEYLNSLLEKAEYDYQKANINNQKDLYAEAFFEENALIITKLITRGSGSIKLTVDDLYISGEKVYAVIKTDVPVFGTDDMQYKSFTFKVKKSEVTNINEVITLE